MPGARDVILASCQLPDQSLELTAFQPLPVFPKMWDEDDPSATILMTQSAPLMVPVNPNNTLRARVLA